MDQSAPIDYYDILQISTTAEPDTVHRVYRLLAQRFHPDNQESGSDSRFRLLTEAYQVISDPEKRAQYDLVHERQRQERWRLIARGSDSENDFAAEQRVRLTALEVLYTKRRTDPDQPGIFVTDLEKMTGRPREHLEFTIWYLVQKKLVQRGDNAVLVITAEGVEYLEDRYQTGIQPLRLRAVNE